MNNFENKKKTNKKTKKSGKMSVRGNTGDENLDALSPVKVHKDKEGSLWKRTGGGGAG